MSEPTEEQIKKFWGWCGWTQKPLGKKGYHWERGERVPNWNSPDDTGIKAEYGHDHLPPIDLNNLFEWAVPKALRLLADKYKDTEDGARHFLFVSWVEGEYGIEAGYDDNLALFWAIWEIIE